MPGNVGSAEVLEMLRKLAGTIRPICDPCAWMIVRRGEVVGLLSIVRRPVSRAIHIGYGIAPSRRNQGFGTNAVRSLLEWARTASYRPDRVTADTGVDNIGSQSILLRNGFFKIGTRLDAEDGPVICWEAPVQKIAS